MLIVLVGCASAFIMPTPPHQEISEKPLIGGWKTEVKGIDMGLDNPNVAYDQSIKAARKCGFCMG